MAIRKLARTSARTSARLKPPCSGECARKMHAFRQKQAMAETLFGANPTFNSIMAKYFEAKEVLSLCRPAANAMREYFELERAIGVLLSKGLTVPEGTKEEFGHLEQTICELASGYMEVEIGS